MKKDYGIITARLASLRRAWRINAAIQGVLSAFLISSPLLIIGIAAGATGYARTVLIAVSLFSAFVIFVWKAAFPLLRPLSLKDAALYAESGAGSMESRISSAVSFSSLPESGAERFDDSMLSALFKQAAADIRGLRFAEVLPIKKTTRLAFSSICAAVVYIAVVAAVPGAANRFPAFIVPPYLPVPEVYSIEWVRSDKLVRIGDSAAISAGLMGRITESPTVHIEREGLDPATKRMKRISSNKYSLIIPSVNADISFTVRYKKAHSRTFTIRAVEPPRIRNMKLRIVYPKYTGLPDETRENSGDIMAVAGTKAFIDIESSEKLRHANIIFNKKTIPMRLKGKTFANGSFTVMRDGTYSIHIKDLNGFENLMPPSYSVKALPDAPPMIQLSSPQADISLPQAVTLLIAGSARDDYGISRVSLNYRLSSGSSGALRIPVQAGPDVSFEYAWDISATGAQPGDTIDFYLTAADNNTITGAQSAKTPTLRITIVSQKQDIALIEKKNEQIVNDLERTVSDAENVSDSFKKLSQNLSNQNISDRQKNTDVQRAIEQQQELEKELADISQRMQENIEHMKSNDLVAFDTLQKMKQIQDMMDQILTKEMRELMKKIQQNVENIDISKLDQSMLDAMKDQEQILRNLDNTLQRLKRIHAEQKMDNAAKRMKDLADRQKQVVEQTEALRKKQQQKGGLSPRERQTLERLAKEEKLLRDELAQEQARLEELNKEMEKLSPESSDALEKMLSKTKRENPGKNLEQASEHMMRQQMPQSVENATEALKSMLSLSKGMSDLNSSYASKINEAMRKMIMHALQKTLNLSGAQESTMDFAARLSSRPGRAVSGNDENKLSSELRFQRDVSSELAAELKNLSNVSMTISPGIYTSAIFASEKMTTALENIKDGRMPDAYSNISSSYKELNRIALALLDARNGGESGSGQSELERFMDHLQSLAESQENLNNMTSRLGSSGLPMPQFMSGMQSLAVQQQVIRESLSQLMRDAKGMGEFGKRMDQISEQMEEIQNALREGRADPALQRRQSDVLRRLKDATLSLRREALEDKRIAETGREYAPATPAPIRLEKEFTLPPDIIRELESLKRESRLKGFEDAIDNYYRQILKPK